MSNVNDIISREIISFMAHAQVSGACLTRWRDPLVGFADAGDPLFVRLRKSVRPDHALPQDLLAGAGSVAAYFLPFERSVPLSNRRGVHASRQWAIAYLETNRLISSLNAHLCTVLRSFGMSAAGIPPTHNFDHETLTSRWSHRHVAYVAGLGTFGINRMLITEKGCCGRLGSLVISGKCTPCVRPGYEFCLNKYDNTCLACVKKCPSGALQDRSFDRRLCYSILMENARLYEKEGLVDVCGKCLSMVPCSHENPAGRPSSSSSEAGR
jgi:epoxyqueuosine reductase QueG